MWVFYSSFPCGLVHLRQWGVGLEYGPWCAWLWWIVTDCFACRVFSGLARGSSTGALALAFFFSDVYFLISWSGVDGEGLAPSMVFTVCFTLYTSIDRLALGVSLLLCIYEVGRGKLIKGRWKFSLYVCCIVFFRSYFLWLYLFFFFLLYRVILFP